MFGVFNRMMQKCSIEEDDFICIIDGTGGKKDQAQSVETQWLLGETSQIPLSWYEVQKSRLKIFKKFL